MTDKIVTIEGKKMTLRRLKPTVSLSSLEYDAPIPRSKERGIPLGNNMSKQLKFVDWKVPLILSGEKNSTWRLFDDKNLQTGDVVDFIEQSSLISFARAKLIDVCEKPFSQLTNEDKQGHEEFSTSEEMYKIYSNYYHRPVGPETKVKIIKFRLLEKYAKS